MKPPITAPVTLPIPPRMMTARPFSSIGLPMSRVTLLYSSPVSTPAAPPSEEAMKNVAAIVRSRLTPSSAAATRSSATARICRPSVVVRNTQLRTSISAIAARKIVSSTVVNVSGPRWITGAVLRGIYGVDERHFTMGGLDTAPMIHLGPLTFTTVELTIFLAAIALMLVLSWVLRTTTLGRQIRAVAEDRVAAALLGVNLERTIAATFFIASSLGGAAGVLTGLEYNSVTLDMGSPIELKGLAVIILGGMGSVTGAVIGGFILGAVETLAIAYGLSAWRDAILFGVMFLLLVARPTGLFGKRALRAA